jgi:hypothetical protein
MEAGPLRRRLLSEKMWRAKASQRQRWTGHGAGPRTKWHRNAVRKGRSRRRDRIERPPACSKCSNASRARPSQQSFAASRRGLVVNRMFGEMYQLRSVASVLVRLPLDSGPATANRCGPTFQMPYTLQLRDSEAGYWTLHLDLIEAAAMLLTRAHAIGNRERADYAKTLASLDATAAREMMLYATADSARTGAHRKREAVR